MVIIHPYHLAYLTYLTTTILTSDRYWLFTCTLPSIYWYSVRAARFHHPLGHIGLPILLEGTLDHKLPPITNMLYRMLYR